MTLLATRRLRIESFSPEHVPAVQAFNQRLTAGGADWQFPDEPTREWLPHSAASAVFQELFLLLESDDVRGAYVLKHRPVAIRGKIRRVGNLSMPLSEGTINRAYSLVWARLFTDAMQREPLLFALGMGGEKTQVSSMVRALGWPTYPVPFFFKVVKANRFLRQIRYLRTTRWRSRLLDIVALSGIGWAVAAGVGTLLTRRPRGMADAGVEEVVSFGSWADELWQSCADRYSFAAVRNTDVLNRVFPLDRDGLLRLRMTRAGSTIGYAVLQDEQSLQSETLGEMRVGTLVDVLATPEDAETVTWLAAQKLEERGVDLLMSNQSHPAWGSALRRAGFIEGPTNCVFAASRRLADLIRALDPNGRELHLNRGDGDQPWGTTSDG